MIELTNYKYIENTNLGLLIQVVHQSGKKMENLDIRAVIKWTLRIPQGCPRTLALVLLYKL